MLHNWIAVLIHAIGPAGLLEHHKWGRSVCTSGHLFKLKNRWWNPGPQTVSVLLYIELYQNLLIGSELPVPKKHPKKKCQEYRKLLHLPTYPPLQEEKKREIGEVTCLADSAVDVICDRLSNLTNFYKPVPHILLCVLFEVKMSGSPHPSSSVDHNLQNCPCYLVDPRIHWEKPSPFHTCICAVYSTAVLEMLRKCMQLIYNHFLEITKPLKIWGRVG